ncbi:hypothetical protein MASR2M78_04220 [Treponema sp.]
MGITISGSGNGFPSPASVGDRAAYSAIQTRHVEVEADKAQSKIVEPKKAALTALDLERTTGELERISLAFNKKLRFVVKEDLDEVIVKVIDPETDKVIKELPPEELQRLHLKIKEMIGILFDERV